MMHSPGDYILLSADKYEIKVLCLISAIPDFKCLLKAKFILQNSGPVLIIFQLINKSRI